MAAKLKAGSSKGVLWHHLVLTLGSDNRIFAVFIFNLSTEASENTVAYSGSVY